MHSKMTQSPNGENCWDLWVGGRLFLECESYQIVANVQHAITNPNDTECGELAAQIVRVVERDALAL